MTTPNKPKKNAAAAALGRLRWADRTPEERAAHGLMMVQAREAKRKKAKKKAKKSSLARVSSGS
jgi:hypothetical protein